MDDKQQKSHLYGVIALAVFGLIVIGLGGIVLAFLCCYDQGRFKDAAMCLIPSAVAFGAILFGLTR